MGGSDQTPLLNSSHIPFPEIPSVPTFTVCLKYKVYFQLLLPSENLLTLSIDFSHPKSQKRQ